MKSSRRFAKAFAAMLLLALLPQATGCSCLKARSHLINVTSSPSGADVRVNGVKAGVTPLRYKVPGNKNVDIVVSKTGYEPNRRYIDKKLSALGKVDAVFGCAWVVPFIGLTAPGAWNLDQDCINMILAPKIQGM
jgi:hypothetical protein